MQYPSHADSEHDGFDTIAENLPKGGVKPQVFETQSSQFSQSPLERIRKQSVSAVGESIAESVNQRLPVAELSKLQDQFADLEKKLEGEIASIWKSLSYLEVQRDSSSLANVSELSVALDVDQNGAPGRDSKRLGRVASAEIDDDVKDAAMHESRSDPTPDHIDGETNNTSRRSEATGNTRGKGAQRHVKNLLKMHQEMSKQSNLSEAAEHGQSFMNLESTVWDASVLVGMTTQSGALYIGFWNSLLLMITNVANVLIQITFIVAVRTSLTIDIFPTAAVDGMFYQRLGGHDYDKVDTSHMETLSALVCGGREHNRLSSTYFKVKDYLQLGIDGVQGRVICVLAVTIWALSMTQELRRAIELASVVLMLPQPTEGYSVKEGGFHLPAVVKYAGRLQRLCLVVFVFVPRVVIAALLLWFGIIFMSGTLQIEDLILNACALEIVKNVDELLFSAISGLEDELAVSRTVVKTYSHYPSRGRLSNFILQRLSGGGQGRGICRLLFLVGVVGWGYFYQVKPFHNQVKEVQTRICGGDLTFVSTSPFAVTMPTIFSSLDLSDDGDLAVETEAVQQMSCLFAAKTEMLALRAGFAPTYFSATNEMYSMASGTHADCGSSLFACPDLTFSQFLRVKSLTSLDVLDANLGFCEDHLFSLEVVRETCINVTFASQSEKVSQFFEKRKSCPDFESLCACPPDRVRSGGHCDLDGLNETEIPIDNEDGTEVQLPFSWYVAIRTMCPRACAACVTRGGGGGPSSTVSTGQSSGQGAPPPGGSGQGGVAPGQGPQISSTPPPGQQSGQGGPPAGGQSSGQGAPPTGGQQPGQGGQQGAPLGGQGMPPPGGQR